MQRPEQFEEGSPLDAPYVPGGHALQDAAPANAKLPAVHLLADALFEAPVCGHIQPAAHRIPVEELVGHQLPLGQMPVHALVVCAHATHYGAARMKFNSAQTRRAAAGETGSRTYTDTRTLTHTDAHKHINHKHDHHATRSGHERI